MEVALAWRMGKSVVVWGAPKPLSPWLYYHSDRNFPTLVEAVEYLLNRPYLNEFGN